MSWPLLPLAPFVVPPLSDATLRRWAATTPRPTPHLPVHPWLYGLLPDDEGTPLVGIAFRLELDVLAHCEEREDEAEESKKIWEKVQAVLTKFPPLRSEFHLAPIQRVREWLEEQKDSCLPKFSRIFSRSGNGKTIVLRRAMILRFETRRG